ncbi:MAG TPA: fumarylacetoacetate hydrolase family protein [Alphaproteobacteria bacterium]|nr:fumarylacetoacetate hydrolase family protein [Alphaproteobacteria bacterium]
MRDRRSTGFAVESAPIHGVDQVSDIADRLHEAARLGVPIEPLCQILRPGGVAMAYQVQSFNVGREAKSGRRIVGRKIGLTSKAVQEQLGVGEPDYGTLLDSMDVSAMEIAPFESLIQPRIEAEIAVVLGRDLDSPTVSLAEAAQAVDCVLPALEIVDSRIKEWRISIFDTIADNASSALFVTGANPVNPKRIDLRLAGMVLEKNGNPASLGVGAACLGSPYRALTWLARRMAEVGDPLRAGALILTGALGPMTKLEPGDSVSAEIQGLGRVSVQFAGHKERLSWI